MQAVLFRVRGDTALGIWLWVPGLRFGVGTVVRFGVWGLGRVQLAWGAFRRRIAARRSGTGGTCIPKPGLSARAQHPVQFPSKPTVLTGWTGAGSCTDRCNY